MLQRIQTIFLFLAVLAFGSLFYLPFAETETAYENFLADKVYNLFDSPILMIVTGLGIVVSLITIFVFNNRPLQIKMTWVAVLLGVLIPILAGIEFYRNTGEMGPGEIDYTLGTGIFIPIIIIIALILAIRNIKKDEKLVRSADRLR